eukprot:311332_1
MERSVHFSWNFGCSVPAQKRAQKPTRRLRRRSQFLYFGGTVARHWPLEPADCPASLDRCRCRPVDWVLGRHVQALGFQGRGLQSSFWMRYRPKYVPFSLLDREAPNNELGLLSI